MNALAARALAALPIDLQALARRAPADLRDDLIGELWLASANAAADADAPGIYRRARNNTMRVVKMCGSVSIGQQEENGDSIELSICNAHAASREPSPSRYRDFVNDIQKPGETRRAAEIRLAKLIERYKNGDLFGEVSA